MVGRADPPSGSSESHPGGALDAALQERGPVVRQEAGGTHGAVVVEPELVRPARARVGEPGADEDRPVLQPGADHGGGRAGGGATAHRTGVGGGHDGAQVLEAAFGGLDLLPGLLGALVLPDADAPEHGRRGDARGEREHRRPAAKDGRERRRPAHGRQHRRQLADRIDVEHDRVLHARGRRQGGGAGQAGGGGGEFGHLLQAGRAVGEVRFEHLVFRRRQGVEGVRAGEGVQFPVVLHVVTPMQSRNRMSPSRMRVLIVGNGVRRVSATSRYVRPW